MFVLTTSSTLLSSVMSLIQVTIHVFLR